MGEWLQKRMDGASWSAGAAKWHVPGQVNGVNLA